MKRMHTMQWMLAGLLAAGLLAGGCQSSSMSIEGPGQTLPDDDGSPAFLDRISSEPTVSENDAFRGLLMLVEDEDATETFEDRVRALVDRGMLPPDWSYDADRPLTRGRLAYMACQAADVEGGVMMHLVGPTRRYCLREARYLGLMSDGGTYGQVTGMEYLAVLTRLDVFRQTGQLPEILSTE
jgi:hypothetical protein